MSIMHFSSYFFALASNHCLKAKNTYFSNSLSILSLPHPEGAKIIAYQLGYPNLSYSLNCIRFEQKAKAILFIVIFKIILYVVFLCLNLNNRQISFKISGIFGNSFSLTSMPDLRFHRCLEIQLIFQY